MQANKCLALWKILILIWLFTGPHYLYTVVNASSHQCLTIKEVIDTNDKINIDSNYEHGKEHYPRYSYAGLSDNFLIKKVPDITLCAGDIRSIEIKRQPFSQPHIPNYVISIHLESAAATKISDYTKRNLDKRIAIEIDGTIFAIPKILEEIREELDLTLGGWSLKEIERELRKISNNIVIHEK